MPTTPQMIAEFSFASLSVKSDKNADDWAHYGSYALGYREPNYPMPVLLTEVKYCSDGIEIRDTEMAKQGEYIWFANESKLPY